MQGSAERLRPGWGPYIKDVRTGRGEGGSPKADILREVAWIYSYRSSQNADKGGEGVQNPENFADVLYVWSLRCIKRTTRSVQLMIGLKRSDSRFLDQTYGSTYVLE